MADLTITGLPDDLTILQGYFVWSGINSEGRKMHGGIEYPYSEDPETSSYDAVQAVGMLTIGKAQLLAGVVYGDSEEGEE